MQSIDQQHSVVLQLCNKTIIVYKGGFVFALITLRRKMNPEDVKIQLEMFGKIVRDEEFFKKTDSILEQFIIEEPKEKKVSDEEKVSKGSDK